MAYDEHLAERVKKVLKEKRIRFEEKKMMGGLCFMVREKMCVGVEKICSWHALARIFMRKP